MFLAKNPHRLGRLSGFFRDAFAGELMERRQVWNSFGLSKATCL